MPTGRLENLVEKHEPGPMVNWRVAAGENQVCLLIENCPCAVAR
jgi:hypothetical protein